MVVKNTRLSQIKPEVGHTENFLHHILNKILNIFMTTGICGKSINISKGKTPTNFKIVVI